MERASCQYEVLNPWAEVDPVPLKGLSPRLTDLKGKTIGLFSNWKTAARPVLTVAQNRLKEREPSLKFSWFEFGLNTEVDETELKGAFEDWVKGCDAVLSAVGD